MNLNCTRSISMLGNPRPNDCQDIFTFNVEGYKRNKFYLSTIIQKYCPLFVFLQEFWLPFHESNKLSNDFDDYNFLTTAADMFTATEDLILQSGPVWHGTALVWKKTLEKFVTKLPLISERFCGVKYVDTSVDTNIIAYTAYLPTSGKDEEFLEILSLLSFDIRTIGSPSPSQK